MSKRAIPLSLWMWPKAHARDIYYMFEHLGLINHLFIVILCLIWLFSLPRVGLFGESKIFIQ